MASKVKEDSDSGNMNIILRNHCSNHTLPFAINTLGSNDPGFYEDDIHL